MIYEAYEDRRLLIIYHDGKLIAYTLQTSVRFVLWMLQRVPISTALEEYLDSTLPVLLVRSSQPSWLMDLTGRSKHFFSVITSSLSPDRKVLTVPLEYTVSLVEGITSIPEDFESVLAAPLLYGRYTSEDQANTSFKKADETSKAGLSIYGSHPLARPKEGDRMVLPGAGSR